MLQRRPRAQTTVAVVVGGVALLGVLATYLITPLHIDLRYEAGVTEVSTHSAAGTFTHRPLAFRLLMDGVFRLARTVSAGPAAFELTVRVLLVLVVLAAGLLLARGLRRQGVEHAGGQAAVTTGAILLVGPLSTGEPDFMAVVLATAGVGAALLGRRAPWRWAVLAGVLFVAAAAMKIVTLPVALVGLLVVGALDRRQLVRSLAASVAVGLLYVLATLRWVPWELQWLLDIRLVQPDPVEALSGAGPFLVELAAERPVLALLPAALVLARGRERLVVATAALLAAAVVVAQGQYFEYHAVTLMVVASVAVFRALRLRTSPAVGLSVLVVVAAATVLTTRSPDWVQDHQALRTWAVVGVSGLAFVWALTVLRRPADRGGNPGMAALATLALLYPGFSPWACNLLPAVSDARQPPTSLQVRALDRATGEQVRQVVGGPDVPVTYLAFGSVTYVVGNPTGCRYPSPLFLQRTRITSRVVDSPSYRDNLTCLSTPGSRWLIWQERWFLLRRTPPEVQATIAREWDCAASVQVGGLRLCPRRT